MLTALRGRVEGETIRIEDDDLSNYNGQQVIITFLGVSSSDEKRERRNAAYLAKIDRGIAQMKEGTMQYHDLVEVEE
jgi:hypothetical protein